MIRGFLLFFVALLFAGAMGFAFGIYAAPAIGGKEFRATVDAGIDAFSESVLSVIGRAKVRPAKVPQATAPAEGEAPSKEAGSDTPAQPQSDAGSGGVPANGATPPDRRTENVTEPSSPVAEPQSAHSTPAVNTEEPVGSISPAAPADKEFKQPAVSRKNPRVEESHVRPHANKPVAKLKPRPKPAHEPVAKLKRKPEPAYRPVARLKPKPRPRPEPYSEPEPEPLHAPVEQPAPYPPHPDAGDGWLPWLR
jgi:hypothetical protein